MIKCNDRVISFLAPMGYSTIYPPRASADPLDLLVSTKSHLKHWGNIEQVFDSTSPAPLLQSDSTVSNIFGEETSNHSFSIGLTILGSLIGAAGGSSLGLKAAYKDATKFEFAYSDISCTYVDPAAIDLFLGGGSLGESFASTREFLKKDRLYIFTRVLKAKHITVTAFNADGAELEIGVPVIKEIVGGDIKVSNSLSNNTAISYQGLIPIAFAFQAVRIDYRKGKNDEERLFLKPVDAGDVSAESVDSSDEVVEFELLPVSESHVDLN